MASGLDPGALRGHPFAGRNIRHAAHDRHQIAFGFHLDPQDREAGLLVVKCHALHHACHPVLWHRFARLLGFHGDVIIRKNTRDGERTRRQGHAWAGASYLATISPPSAQPTGSPSIQGLALKVSAWSPCLRALTLAESLHELPRCIFSETAPVPGPETRAPDPVPLDANMIPEWSA